MSDLFDIKEYVVDGQHIREYARATAHSQEEVLHLAVKQYIPKDNTTPKPGDITIVTSHANCFPKVSATAMHDLSFPSSLPTSTSTSTNVKEKTDYRKSTSHYGKTSCTHVARTVSISVAFGPPIPRGRVRVALSTRTN